MSNKEIASFFKTGGQLMELHNENPFKTRSWQNAVFRIERSEKRLSDLNQAELEAIEGIGKGIAARIIELRETGTMAELEAMIAKTPPGVIDMLAIKGIGPKKVHTIWKEMDIESTGELLYACHENRLVDLKGFGQKTQEMVIKNIEYMRANKGKFHFDDAEIAGLALLEYLNKSGETTQTSFAGSIRRCCEIIEVVEILAATIAFEKVFHLFEQPSDKLSAIHSLHFAGNEIRFVTEEGMNVCIYLCSNDEFALQLFHLSASPEHLTFTGSPAPGSYASETDIYTSLGFPYIIPELREGLYEQKLTDKKQLGSIVKLKDLKGVLHNHSTYSDGANTLREMALYCREIGYEYFGICDHSQSAFYANGLKPERIVQQHAEIDKLNTELAPFRIFKGIESDILNDGELDYSPEVLATFDMVVASVHSNLKMTEEKANRRLLRAIENPYTTILGHPTSRLLLSREGYPIDHRMIIEACAANKVIIELNAHPYRLDIDWRWIQYALDCGVMISINPDAHKREGFHDMYYGVCVARKGGLTRDMTFNALGLGEMEAYLKGKRGRV